MTNILDKMTSYVNHINEPNVNNNNNIVNMIRNNLVKQRNLNAKIYAHNMAVRAQKHKNTNKTPRFQPSTTNRRKPRVIIDKSVITNKIIF